MTTFAELVRTVHGHEPYPWQLAFADRCLTDGPPRVLAAPTGAGKTLAVDALVWALAELADRPAAERPVGVRIVWAIDRRLLVDEVHSHAAKLASRLADAVDVPDDPLHGTASGLVRLSGDRSRPLMATRWRGGLGRHEDPHDASQPQVITSTVAQVGSRLLFRGYGLSDRSHALGAGQSGSDTTLCLDEAHLAAPLRETVDAIAARRRNRAVDRTAGSLPGLRTVAITATPDGADAHDVLRLSDADRAALGRRLDGPKTAELREPADRSPASRVGAVTDAAIELLDEGTRTVACVVNRVARAERIHARLQKALGDRADVVLLIGPQRPVDRGALLARHWNALAGLEVPERPVVCVATQTFEVGLDADVEAMVLESASASAVVQRLGRLNRAGTRETGRAIVIRDDDSPLYGDDETAAWAWLRGLAEARDRIDVSVAALADDPGRPRSRAPRAPELTTSVVEGLLQTCPRPGPMQDPDIEPFLRGQDSRASADVHLCWRAGLRLGEADRDAVAYRRALLAAVPPRPEELLTLSLPAARRFLAELAASDEANHARVRLVLDEADVDGGGGQPSDVPNRSPEGDGVFVVLREREVLGAGDGHVSIGGLRPGDVVLLGAHGAPSASGGRAIDDAAPDVRNRDAHTKGSPANVAAPPVRLESEVLEAARRASSDPTPAGGDHAIPQAIAAGTARTELGEFEQRLLTRYLAEAEEPRPPGAGRGTAGDQASEGAAGIELLETLASEPGGGRSLPAPTRQALTRLRNVISGGEHVLEVRRLDPSTGADDVPFPTDEEEWWEPSDEDPWPGADGEPEPDGDRAADAALLPWERTVRSAAWVLLARRRAPVEDRRRRPSQVPTLRSHAEAVRDRLAATVERLGLAPEFRDALLLAARAHDHGKADPRMQAFFRAGAGAPGAEPLAKSVFGTGDRTAAADARRASGWPRRLRHEIASVAVLRDAARRDRLTAGDQEVDVDLALHLVGTHHGDGRPAWSLPEREGRPPATFGVDLHGVAGSARGDGVDGWEEGAWFGRFWTIQRRLDPWGAAYLESLLVLADRTVSAEGS